MNTINKSKQVVFRAMAIIALCAALNAQTAHANDTLEDESAQACKTTAFLRVFNRSSGAVRIYFDGELLISSLARGSISQSFKVCTGTHAVQSDLVARKDDIPVTRITNLKAGKKYTLTVNAGIPKCSSSKQTCAQILPN